MIYFENRHRNILSMEEGIPVFDTGLNLAGQKHSGMDWRPAHLCCHLAKYKIRSVSFCLFLLRFKQRKVNISLPITH